MFIFLNQGFNFDKENHRVRCFTHALNLGCKDSINAVNTATLGFDAIDIRTDGDLDSDLRAEKGLISKVRA